MYKIKNNKGFTLLELIVSLAIIVSIMFGFFRVINSTQRINTKNDRDIKALNILQSEIENLRSQIKQSINEGEDRVLFVEDDVTGEKIEIEFDENTDEALVPEYSKVDKNTNSIYKVNDLKIKRQLIIGNNKSQHKAFNDYEYTIDIKAILDDNYFSKKITQIDDVKILSSSIAPSETGKNIIERPNESISHGHHQAIILTETTDLKGFLAELENKSYQGRFIEYKKTHYGNDMHDEWSKSPPPDGAWMCKEGLPDSTANPPILFKVKDVKIILEYKKKIDNENYIEIKLSIKDAQTGETIDSYKTNEFIEKFTHKRVNEIGIEVENAAVILKELSINGEYIGDVEKNTVYQLKDSVDEVTLEFYGFVKYGEGKHPNADADKRKVYIEFADSQEE